MLRQADMPDDTLLYFQYKNIVKQKIMICESLAWLFQLNNHTTV